MTALLVPTLLVFAAAWAAYKKVDFFSAMTAGAASGLDTVKRIFPSLIVLLTAIAMLRASGITDALSALLSPLLSRVGIPAETVPLMLLRPLSGSGALAIGSELMARFGPDSRIGRTTAVMLGSTETTFYVIGVYFGSLGIKKTRHAVPAALAADLAGFLTAALTVRLFFS